jgi:leader peptidase (prepilin peptidase)/N-methyltransferase
MSALAYTVPAVYFFPYFIFFSALIVTIRSDLETLLISRYVTLFLIPIAFALSATGMLPIDLTDSISGALAGYAILFMTAKLFLWLTGKEGMGQGDVELLAFIGSFVGILGCWFSLLLGSVIGSCVGFGYLLITKAGRSAKIPFGPFLAGGAMCFVLLQERILALLVHYATQ